MRRKAGRVDTGPARPGLSVSRRRSRPPWTVPPRIWPGVPNGAGLRPLLPREPAARPGAGQSLPAAAGRSAAGRVGLLGGWLGGFAGGEAFDDAEFEPVVPFDGQAGGLDVVEGAAPVVL